MAQSSGCFREFSHLITLTQRRQQPLQNCYFSCLDVVPYSSALGWQRSLVTQRRHNPDLADVLLLLEHEPVYTLGQGARLAFVKFDPVHSPWSVHRVERGGEVTYHCPGQLVGYPILNLRHHRQDLHWYLRQLEAVIIATLAHYGLQGDRLPGLTGVWVEGRKVAALGIKVSRWITSHGFALNVCPDLGGFGRIVPCGIADRPVGSLAEWLPDITVAAVAPIVAAKFAHLFSLELIGPVSLTTLL